MKNRYLEAGKIVNTHGIKGEVKIVPWADAPEFLLGFDTLYVDGAPVRVRASRVHNTVVLASLEGVDTVEEAMRLKGKVISIDREDAALPQGRHFLADLIGLAMLDADTGAELGRIADVLPLPAHEVYVVRGGVKEYMIPAVDEFLEEVNVDEGYVKVRLIEGMAD